MKRLIFVLLVALVGCSKYGELLEPLRNIPANCYCRYAEAAKTLYLCHYNENRLQGMRKDSAAYEARLVAYRWIRDVQIQEARKPRLRCDCNDPRLRQ